MKVMRVLRENRDSVMAMLEAFIYDPLISWRLLKNDRIAEMDSNASKTEPTNISNVPSVLSRANSIDGDLR